MSKVNEAAALHFAKGVIEDQEVPVGRHNLAGCRVVIDFPDNAAVERSEGTAGEGFDETKPPALKLTLGMALRFATLCDFPTSKAKALWRTAIAHELRDEGKFEIPSEAALALDEAEQARKAPEPGKRKTVAKRSDPKLSKVSVLQPGETTPRRAAA